MKKTVLMLAICILVSRMIAAQPGHHILRARTVVRWIHATVRYVASPDVIKSPAATLMSGGDCADMSALMVSLLRAEEIDAKVLLLDLRDFDVHHAVVSVFGFVYDPVTGEEYRDGFPLPHTIVDAVTYENLLLDWEVTMK